MADTYKVVDTNEFADRSYVGSNRLEHSYLELDGLDNESIRVLSASARDGTCKKEEVDDKCGDYLHPVVDVPETVEPLKPIDSKKSAPERDYREFMPSSADDSKLPGDIKPGIHSTDEGRVESGIIKNEYDEIQTDNYECIQDEISEKPDIYDRLQPQDKATKSTKKRICCRVLIVSITLLILGGLAGAGYAIYQQVFYQQPLKPGKSGANLQVYVEFQIPNLYLNAQLNSTNPNNLFPATCHLNGSSSICCDKINQMLSNQSVLFNGCTSRNCSFNLNDIRHLTCSVVIHLSTDNDQESKILAKAKDLIVNSSTGYNVTLICITFVDQLNPVYSCSSSISYSTTTRSVRPIATPLSLIGAAIPEYAVDYHICQPVIITECSKYFANTSITNSSQAFQSGNAYFDFNEGLCHPHDKAFLCALAATPCFMVNDTVVNNWPCQSFCVAIRKACEVYLIYFNFQWPINADCNQFSDDPPCYNPMVSQ